MGSRVEWVKNRVKGREVLVNPERNLLSRPTRSSRIVSQSRRHGNAEGPAGGSTRWEVLPDMRPRYVTAALLAIFTTFQRFLFSRDLLDPIEDSDSAHPRPDDPAGTSGAARLGAEPVRNQTRRC